MIVSWVRAWGVTVAKVAQTLPSEVQRELNERFKVVMVHTITNAESWVSLEDLAADSLLTQDEVIGILQGLERKGVLYMIPDPNAPRIQAAAAR